MSLRHASIIVIAGYFLTTAAPVVAGTLNVPGDFAFIQLCIDAATSGVDECVVAPGTYNETINFNGKAITLRSSEGPDVTTIDGTGLNDSVVKCVSGEGPDTVLRGFTITGGTGDTSMHGHPVGGGMVIFNGSPTIEACKFHGNSAREGGAVHMHTSNAVINNCTFAGNIATWAGISNFGGGVHCEDSTATLLNSIFKANTAFDGGGLFNDLNSSTIVTNCLFSGNSADRFGGGMANSGSSPVVTNCTFGGNQAGSRSGAMENAGNSSPIVTNCILWSDTPNEMVNDNGAGVDHPTVSFSDIAGGLPPGTIDGGNNINADPLFVDPIGLDGIPGTEDDDLRLLPGSPCIDAGDNSVVTESTDLAGNPRLVDGDGDSTATVDMGGYELVPPCQAGPTIIYVDILICPGQGTGTLADPFCEIQGGIDAACNGDTVLVALGTYNETINFSGKAITLRSAAGPGVTSIDGIGLNDAVVKCNSGEGPDTRLEGFTITRGIGHPFNPTHRFGGGMYNENASPTVIDCIFIDNVLSVGGANQGGGMFNLNSSPTVRGCRFMGNSVTDTGGGMNNSSSSSPLVTDCLFMDNSAGISGGGMYNLSDSSPTVVRSRFISNVAASAGGGMHSGHSVGAAPSIPKLTNCVFDKNTAGGSGGGMFTHGGGIPLVRNCTFTANTAATGGGMYNSGILGATNTSIVNSIFWNNTDNGGTDTSAQIHDDSGSESVVDYSDVQGGWTGAGGIGNINADPFFVDPIGLDGIRGTEDDDLRLLPGSPCIDAGENSVVTESTDLAGNPRVVDGDGDSIAIVDMGAYELVPACQGGATTIYVDILTCPAQGTGAVADPFCRIQDGISAACDADTVLVAPGTYNECIDFGGKAITLRSSDGPDVTAIDGTGLACTVVTCVRGEGADTLLEGFTVTGGTAQINDAGGGMTIIGSSPTVRSCVFAQNIGQHYGGGMGVTFGSHPVIVNCKFIENDVSDGGGMLIAESSSATITDCLFANHTLTVGASNIGGGIVVSVNSGAEITNSTFVNNVVDNTAGGMYIDGTSNVNIRNCVFWNNRDNGGADESAQIYGAATVTYSDIQGCTSFCAAPGDQNINADPTFVDPIGPDGIPGTADDDLRLLSGSPCIDAGDNSVVTESTDLAGNPRIVDGDGDSTATVDMGAYEFVPECEPGPWLPGAAMPIGRVGTGAAKDSQGRIYIPGGNANVGGVNLPSAEVIRFDETTNTWESIDDLTGPNWSPAVASDHHGRVYTIGGADLGGTYADVHVYDPAQPELGWVPGVSLPLPRGSARAVTDSFGRIYVAGGQDDTHLLDSVLVFDPSQPELGWLQHSNMQQARTTFGFAIDSRDRIYAFGGNIGGGHTNTVERFDPADGMWSYLQPLDSSRDVGVGVADSCDFIYAIGGWEPGYTCKVQRFNPATDTWEDFAPIAHCRNNMAGILGDSGRLYAFGGDGPQTTVEFFDTCVCDQPPKCETDSDCDDGDFCNGPEFCDAGTCLTDNTPCAGETPFCNETFDICCECNECGQDADCDGLLDGWETNGIDSNGDSQIDLDLAALGADPLHKDVFVEVDAMHGRAPAQATLSRVVAAFADVPNDLIENPDGMDGVTLHIQLDETNIPRTDWTNLDAWGWPIGFDTTKTDHFGTALQRADPNWTNIRTAKGNAYRYCVFANSYGGSDSSGLAEQPGNDFMVTLAGCNAQSQCWRPAGGTPDQQSGTFMHELGHNLGLYHGGDQHDPDNVFRYNFKPNYHSVMSYTWQMPRAGYTQSWQLDYSNAAWPVLDEADLDEGAGIGGHQNHSVPVGPPLPRLRDQLVWEDGALDWNRNGVFDPYDPNDPVSADINRIKPWLPASPDDVLRGHNDWRKLRYPLSGHANFADGVHTETTINDEMTFDVFEELNLLGAVFEPPVTNASFTLQDWTTVPIKFHLTDAEDGLIDKERPVHLEVTGADPGGAPVTYVFELGDQTLRYDDTAEPPHYVANFHTRQYPVMDGGEYAATVFEDGVPIGSIMFIVDAAHGSGRGNGPPNAKESSDGAVTGDANGDMNGGESPSALNRANIGCGGLSIAAVLLAFVGLHLMRPRRSPMSRVN